MKKLTRIGINARPFTHKSLRGIARHTLELIKELHALDPDLEFFLYNYDHIDNFYKELFPFVHWRENKIQPRILWDLFYLSRLLKKDKVQIFHSTNNLGLPLFSTAKRVVTIHDALTHRHRTLNTLKSFYGRILYFVEYFILKKSDAFITISKTAHREICDVMDINADQLRVIYNGANNLKASGYEHKREDFYLYVGGLEERKNIAYLLKACEKAQQVLNKKLKIVFVSQLSSATEEVKELINTSKMIIEIKENVSDFELGEIYQKSKALINPSLHEGFGLPVIEAMRTGTPVLISNIEVFKEITEDRAFFFDPKKEEELANLIINIEKGTLDLNQYVPNAKNCASKYSWAVMAQQTLTLYRELVQN